MDKTFLHRSGLSRAGRVFGHGKWPTVDRAGSAKVSRWRDDGARQPGKQGTEKQAGVEMLMGKLMSNNQRPIASVSSNASAGARGAVVAEEGVELLEISFQGIDSDSIDPRSLDARSRHGAQA